MWETYTYKKETREGQYSFNNWEKDSFDKWVIIIEYNNVVKVACFLRIYPLNLVLTTNFFI